MAQNLDLNLFYDFKKELIENISKTIIGKNEIIKLLGIAIICDGHVLLEDSPGLGKTKLARAFSKTIGCDYKRIQFTPDLLPSDLTGINFYNRKINEFEFKKGPIFTNIILADEINRATPRTQSSLLEAMEEKQISVDGLTRKLDSPYMVVATQNPIESHGTFPLPEAQMDRFLMRISMGYPSIEDEIKIIKNNVLENSIEDLVPIVQAEDIKKMKETVKRVSSSKEVDEYLLNIINLTRSSNRTTYGASPRASIALYKASQVNAAFEGRDYIIPEDVKEMAKYVLNHRVGFKGSFNNNIYDSIKIILKEVKVPFSNGE